MRPVCLDRVPWGFERLYAGSTQCDDEVLRPEPLTIGMPRETDDRLVESVTCIRKISTGSSHNTVRGVLWDFKLGAHPGLLVGIRSYVRGC